MFFFFLVTDRFLLLPPVHNVLPQAPSVPVPPPTPSPLLSSSFSSSLSPSLSRALSLVFTLVQALFLCLSLLLWLPGYLSPFLLFPLSTSLSSPGSLSLPRSSSGSLATSLSSSYSLSLPLSLPLAPTLYLSFPSCFSCSPSLCGGLSITRHSLRLDAIPMSLWRICPCLLLHNLSELPTPLLIPALRCQKQ